jgi:NTP pyrophosphatase (non-canonical NTP hydrolase)
MTAGPYSIGSDHCPGLSKLAEEAGEVVQVVGKVIGFGSLGDHWDGSNLRERLEDELADLSAAIQFVALANNLNFERIDSRWSKKLALFQKWHAEQQQPGRGLSDDDAAAIGRSYGIGIGCWPKAHDMVSGRCSACGHVDGDARHGDGGNGGHG